MRKLVVDGVPIGFVERTFNPEGIPLISSALIRRDRLADQRGLHVDFVDPDFEPTNLVPNPKQGDTMAQAHEEYAGEATTDGEAIHHVRPVQRSATVSIEGVPVGWAKITVGSGTFPLISQIVLHESHLEKSSNFFFGISDDDETPQPNVPAPVEPGFYHYSDGRQTMLFLLKDNREAKRFFEENDIKSENPENDWQWYVVMDNGETDRCEWGYIEQALVDGNELVKI